jgi:hypothetical protein
MNQPQFPVNQNMLLEQMMKCKISQGGIPGFELWSVNLCLMFAGIPMSMSGMVPNMIGGINRLFMMQGA